jgi:hypothetical protein
LEGIGNIKGNESNENVSSGEISGKSLTQKRTTNIAQEGSIEVAQGVSNDSTQAQTKQLTVRGLIETIRTCATNIYIVYIKPLSSSTG